MMTDSGGDMTPEETARAGIVVVPITIIFGSERLRDGVDLDRRAFAKRIAAGELPTTEPPSVEDYRQAFDRAVKAGNQVVLLTVSAKISKSFENAKAAAAAFAGAVEVVDSLCASGGESLLAIYAMELAKAGNNAATIAAKLQPSSLKRASFFAVWDVTHLGRTGRLPKALVALGGMLGVSLVLKFNDVGEIGLAGQSRSFDKTCDLLVESLLRAVNHAPNIRVAISHAQNEETAAMLSRTITAKLGHAPMEERVNETTPSIAANMGPGAVGIFAIVP
ncbi:MAG: DegV family protein [bacterium]|nr:DegV family protein [bacterium]